jgi:hypothetical protein
LKPEQRNGTPLNFDDQMQWEEPFMIDNFDFHGDARRSASDVPTEINLGGIPFARTKGHRLKPAPQVTGVFLDHLYSIWTFG